MNAATSTQTAAAANHPYAPLGGAKAPVKAAITDHMPATFAEAVSPSDVLGMYMALMEEMSRNTLDASEHKVEVTREKIAQAMAELKKQLQEITRKLQEREDDDDWGFLGDVVDWVCDAVGEVFEVIGTGIEVAIDVARGPIDIIVGALKGENIQRLIEQELTDASSQGKLSKTIGEAGKGIARFVLDVAKSVVEFGKALSTGQDPFTALAGLGKDLWGALKHDILENPAVMEVLGTVLKAVAIAAAVMTGGALAFVAVGLMLLSDMNKEFGLAEKAFGKEAGGWVSVGLEVVAAVCMAVATLGADAVPGLLGDVQQVASTAGAVLQVANGVNTVVNAIDQRELDHMTTNAQAIRLRMAALQRMLDVALSELSERVEGRDRVRKGGAEAAQIQGEALAAAVYYKG